MTHVCVSNLTIIGADNGLSPGRRQAIIYTNTGILLIRTIGKKSVKSYAKLVHFIQEKAFENGGHFVSASMC